ncbi:hypothetical protein [uncultured Pseudomonas sp.]|uniref:hypothetical protein n=1 Tax=uncultured Pseudomonas sp. TaxID=114707 RepID=UPI0025DF99A3|nr:hypothetical protein [uncultured Pseudomonas sp.]
MRPHYCDVLIKKTILIAILLIAAIDLYAVKGLYADGSFFLYNILSREAYWDFDHPRAFAQIVTQTPIIIGIKLNIKDITSLIYIYNFGVIGIPALVWLLALAQHLKSSHFWTLLIAFSATYLSSGFFAIGEYNLTYALSAYCFSTLIKGSLNRTDSILLILSAICLTRSYEAMIFIGPVLFALAAIKLNETAPSINTRSKLTLFFLLFLFSAAVTVSASSMLYPRDPANLAAAGNILSTIKNKQFIFLILLTTTYFINQIPLQQAKPLTILLFLATVILVITSQQPWNSPSMNYTFRSASGLILCYVFAATLAIDIYKKYRNYSLPQSKTKFTATISLIAFAPLYFVSTTHSIDFSNWIKRFEIEAQAASGWSPIDEFKLLAPYNGYNSFSWPWTNPSLSILLKGDSTGGILNSKAYIGWQPFTPEELQNKRINSFLKKSELFIIK